MQNVAILDLGSNSTRLGIYQINADGAFQETKRLKEMTRLAEGMGASEQGQRLSAAAMDRTLAALRSFKAEYQQVPNLTVRGVATAAVRNAQNSAEFLERIKQEIGVQIEVLSGNAEAYYDYAGVMHALDLQNCLICDMGGGSFELVLVQTRKAVDYLSIPYGAVTLSEKFHAHDQISAADFFALQRFVLYKFSQLPWLEQGRGLPLVLLGGANRTVARQGFWQGQAKAGQSLHGTKMSAYAFIEVFAKWLSQNKQEREQSLGIEKDRADIIIGGLTPVVMLLEKYLLPEVIFSESGVREGIIAETLKKQ